MLENVLRRVDIFLRHFEMILSKSQKGFATRLILPSWWRLRQPFCDLDKITSKWRKKISIRHRTFSSIPYNIFGFQAIHSKNFESHVMHRRNYIRRNVGLVELLGLVSGAHVLLPVFWNFAILKSWKWFRFDGKTSQRKLRPSVVQN